MPKGSIVNTYGDVDGDFTLSLKIKGDRLLHQEKYSVFILTKEGSVVTYGNGDEIKNGDRNDSQNPSNAEERA